MAGLGGVNVDVDGAEDEKRGEGGGAGVTNSLPPPPLPLPTLRPRSSVLEKRGMGETMPPPLATAAAPLTPFTMGEAVVAAEVEADVPKSELPL